MNSPQYSEDNIRHLSDMEHIRTRPGMYIGRLSDGSQAEDGIYVLLKEVIDNSIDEFKMGAGKRIEVDIEDNLRVSIRDYGRGIPLGKLVEAVSMLNTGGKYDSKAFQKSVGLNGVGLKAVNALSARFEVQSFRDGQTRRAVFSKGILQSDVTEATQDDENGTAVFFEPDASLFKHYAFRSEFIEVMLRNYTYLNTGLTIVFNGRRILSRDGLSDLLSDRMDYESLYPIVHLRGQDIEIAFTHTKQNGEEYYSFVNGQNTTLGGTHQAAFKKYIAEVIKDYSGKNYEYADIRNGIVAAISINIQEPLFESQTKVKLGSTTTEPEGGISIDKFIGDFVKEQVDNYLHKNTDIADIILQKVAESEKLRKEMAGVAKKAREMSKKANLHNRKLRDCRVHLTDVKGTLQEESSIFITEGDSASGSITKSRDVNTQAVFSLRGKPLNCINLTKKVVYENEEFNLLQAALNIEDGLDGLRYNKVIVATDADDDGMHIRLLMLTFFLKFFPDLVKKGHVFILQTPLFRVRARKAKLGKTKVNALEAELAARNDAEDVSSYSDGKRPRHLSISKDFVTQYCYTDEERQSAIDEFGPEPEITRFKGLGEISPDEFRNFIGPDMRLDQVILQKSDQVAELLDFYMGDNTMDRQNFIIDNLVIEEDLAEGSPLS
ncbi:MAG: type IIA DNA topoisomerase subunit B [Bacteroidaceae bacterium]|jgi:topoisomerase-4 subunit B|nr:type IIA DNA topoisomerase subunit B [Bacteroidaceae bacterium]MBQ2300063.1 type IIA DNA topoisomerase subunit B [Bacteroidaceae bacterium]MBR0544522.1 type IIA DNA topoisomerase subunit B [Bacteroidaceae bacterium]